MPFWRRCVRCASTSIARRAPRFEHGFNPRLDDPEKQQTIRWSALLRPEQLDAAVDRRQHELVAAVADRAAQMASADLTGDGHRKIGPDAAVQRFGAQL